VINIHSLENFCIHIAPIATLTTMRAFLSFSTLALPFGTSAGVLRLFPRGGAQCPAGSCAFTLSVNGGPVYENPTDSHQLAFGGSKPGAAVEFCTDQKGEVTDNAGVCGITQNTGNDQETTQFQCDVGMSECSHLSYP
jgi:hypothetical protein